MAETTMEQLREEANKLIREVAVFLGELDEMDKTFSRLRNEGIELYKKLDDIRDSQNDSVMASDS